MSRSRSKEITVGLAGSSIAAGGFLLYNTFYKQPTYPIRSLLNSKHPNRKWLSSSSSSEKTQRQQSWDKYKRTYKGLLNDPLSIPHTVLNAISNNSGGTDTDAPSEFMSKCEELSKKEVVDERDYVYRGVYEYCTTE
ncbi:hypothetical protein MHC_01105 [Mycoplasma haemocanis str. Illinois]|uniref:Uncharacterized protein n=1 Tax=Mycoplasma haemocanis (strain Illinois) TaxID=1111676 RepID=H6N615_MYCHN|nr:hypothetical protein [Mycoplasma haemocanis]AEW45087.1 hypothetical protein MHC_01105 [Mycoplasma haemocanis str. Illinois]